MGVYEKVLKYIVAKELDQESIAQNAGIPLDVFEAILIGKQPLYADDLRAICIALNVSPELFVDVPSERKNTNKD